MAAPSPYHRGITALAVAIATALAPACEFENPGARPPSGQLNFPTALALSPAIDGLSDGDGDPSPGTKSRHLFVVNSNFDLAYNKGSLQAYDLGAIAATVRRCGDPDTADDACVFDDEGLVRVDSGTVVVGEALIDSFGTGIALSAQADPGDNHRIFVPIRSQGHLSYTEYRPGPVGGPPPDNVLFCGTEGSRRCTVDFQVDERSVGNNRDLAVPGEPVAVIAGALSDWNPAAPSDANYVMTAHSRGEVSLFVDIGSGDAARLTLTDTLNTFPGAITGLFFDPMAGLAYLTGGGDPLTRVGVALSPDSLELAEIYDGGPLRLDGFSEVANTRDGLVVPSGDGSTAEALIVTRRPDALIFVPLGPDRRTSLSTPVGRTVEVGGGASRLAMGTLTTEGGASREIVVVSCFNGRQLFVIDRNTGATLSVVPNFSGPFEIALDAPRGLLYVADFRSSVVRIVDLLPVLAIDQGLTDEPTSAAIVATLGKPRVVQELQ